MNTVIDTARACALPPCHASIAPSRCSCLERALCVDGLFSLSTAALNAAPAPDMLPIKSYSDVAAAAECLAKHYPWMVRIGPDQVLCLMSAAGVVKRAVSVQSVIDAATRRVRGK